ncbi:Uncharacterised protein [Citrobacter freundii]|nr:Uncharacterised protein [Citrobacter freundii]
MCIANERSWLGLLELRTYLAFLQGLFHTGSLLNSACSSGIRIRIVQAFHL